MKAHYDPDAEALYVHVKEVEPGGVDHTEEHGPVNVDYDEAGEIVGYEFLLSAPLEILTDENTGGGIWTFPEALDTDA